MFGTIRKHQTWLWMVIITLTVISFVIYFSPYSKMNSSARRSGDYGSINGERVTEVSFGNAAREVELYYFFNSGGHWPEEDRQNSRFDIQRETYQWLLLIQKQEQLGIHVGTDVTERIARQLLHQFERNERLSPTDFIQKVLQPRGFGVEDFGRYIQHFVGLQEMMGLIGLSGKLVTPQDAKAIYERERQEVATEAVFFSASNFMAKVAAAPEAVTQYYQSRSNNYAVLERVQVSYVRFNVTNYLAKAETEITNLTDLVDANFQRIGTNLATLFPEAKTPEQGKASIREQIIRSKAMDDAQRKALDFANVLFDLKPVSPDSLQTLARSNGLTAAVMAPFTRDEGPKELEGASATAFAKAAFGLSPDEPFGGPLRARDGVYVFALNKTLPREVPPLDQVREQVTTDFKHSQALMLAQQAASAFYQTATNGLAQGKAFTNLCAEAKLTPEALPPFSLSSRTLPGLNPSLPLNQLQQIAFTTAPGKLSSVEPTSDGAMLLYVQAKLPLDPAKMESEMPSFVASLRRSREQEAFNVWLNHEAGRALRDTPVGRPQPPPSLGAGSSAKS